MPKSHIISQGESVESVAFENGHFWETVWNDPANADLRETREHHNILVEDDELVIPDLRPKTVSADLMKRHRFRRRGVPSILRVRLLDAGEPRAGEAYTVEFDGNQIKGTTDDDGWVICHMMPDITSGVLKIDETGEQFNFQVGTVRPSDMTTGVQTRLRNLGFYDGPMDGQLSEETIKALQAFQAANQLPVTDEPDTATNRALLEKHGS